MARSHGESSGASDWEQIGATLVNMTRPNNALIQDTLQKMVIKCSGGDCMLVITRWSAEGMRMEVCFVVSDSVEGAFRKLERLARARELQWRPDRYTGAQ